MNLPPRHLKTFLASTCLASWTLAQNPKSQVLVISYNEDLAETIADEVRHILRAQWFKQMFSCRIAKGIDRVDRFRTTAGGRLLATSFAAKATGRGADLIIVDDPHRVSDATSPRRLETVCGIFDSEIASRLNDPRRGRIMLASHRVAADDLSGHLERQGGWNRLALPFVAEEPEAYPIEGGTWFRLKGELLRPDAFTHRQVEQLQSRDNFWALYQQCRGQAAFTVSDDHFVILRDPPRSLSGTVFSIDAAQKDGSECSFSVIQIWKRWNGGHHLLGEYRDQVGFIELKKAFWSLYNKYRPAVVLVEDAALGGALLDTIRSRCEGHGVIVQAIAPGRKSKLERFAEVHQEILDGRISLPERAWWRADFIHELTSFPNGEFDDQVDAATQYLRWTRENPNVPARPSRCWGVIATSTRVVVLGGGDDGKQPNPQPVSRPRRPLGVVVTASQLDPLLLLRNFRR